MWKGTGTQRDKEVGLSRHTRDIYSAFTAAAAAEAVPSEEFCSHAEPRRSSRQTLRTSIPVKQHGM